MMNLQEFEPEDRYSSGRGTRDHIGEATEPVVKQAFRDAMAGVATPVSVVTTISTENVPHGTTVSAFGSLSMEPPMLMLALDNQSNLLRKLRKSEQFGLNVLAHDQSSIAVRFAKKDGSKFDGVGWAFVDGAPRINGVAGWVSCVVGNLVPGGDHVVVFGEVVSASSSAVPPLTYHARGFGTHSAHRLDSDLAQARSATSAVTWRTSTQE